MKNIFISKNLLMVVATAVGFSSACKPNQKSRVKSLENFAAGRDLRINQCNGDLTPALMRQLDKDIPVIIDGANLDRNALKLEVLAALSAVPEHTRTLFRAAGGKILLTKSTNAICAKSGRLPGETGSFRSCTVSISNPASSNIKDQIFEGTTIVIYADAVSIRHALVRSFGFFLPDALANVPAFGALVTQIGKAFLTDMARSKIFSLTRFEVLFGKDSAAIIKRNIDLNRPNIFQGLSVSKENLQAFQRHVMGEAFDSYFCRSGINTNYNADIVARIKSTGDLNGFAFLTDTRKVMIDFFPATYRVFQLTESFLTAAGSGVTNLISKMPQNEKGQSNGFALNGFGLATGGTVSVQDYRNAALSRFNDSKSAYQDAMKKYKEASEARGNSWFYSSYSAEDVERLRVQWKQRAQEYQIMEQKYEAAQKILDDGKRSIVADDGTVNGPRRQTPQDNIDPNQQSRILTGTGQVVADDARAAGGVLNSLGDRVAQGTSSTNQAIDSTLESGLKKEEDKALQGLNTAVNMGGISGAVFGAAGLTGYGLQSIFGQGLRMGGATINTGVGLLGGLTSLGLKKSGDLLTGSGNIIEDVTNNGGAVAAGNIANGVANSITDTTTGTSNYWNSIAQDYNSGNYSALGARAGTIAYEYLPGARTVVDTYANTVNMFSSDPAVREKAMKAQAELAPMALLDAVSVGPVAGQAGKVGGRILVPELGTIARQTVVNTGINAAASAAISAVVGGDQQRPNPAPSEGSPSSALAERLPSTGGTREADPVGPPPAADPVPPAPSSSEPNSGGEPYSEH